MVSLATGVLAYDMINKMAKLIEKKIKNVKVNCYKIINNFFGEKITVSGLITGTDLIDQLKDKELGDRLLLPNNILRSGEDVFLDDYKLQEVSDRLGVPIVITKSDGEGIVNAIINGDGQNKDNGNFARLKEVKEAYVKAKGTDASLRTALNETFFSANINYYEFSPNYEVKSDFMSVFNYGDTKFNNPEQTAIADLVLTKNVETFNLRHGYRAQTHLGSMKMYHSILEAARSN